MTSVVNINDVLDGHVSLDIACIDRLYLNAYIPNMQVGGQVNQFCRHLGQQVSGQRRSIGTRYDLARAPSTTCGCARRGRSPIMRYPTRTVSCDRRPVLRGRHSGKVASRSATM